MAQARRMRSPAVNDAGHRNPDWKGLAAVSGGD